MRPGSFAPSGPLSKTVRVGDEVVVSLRPIGGDLLALLAAGAVKPCCHAFSHSGMLATLIS